MASSSAARAAAWRSAAAAKSSAESVAASIPSALTAIAHLSHATHNPAPTIIDHQQSAIDHLQFRI